VTISTSSDGHAHFSRLDAKTVTDLEAARSVRDAVT
jgi:hypothetical protein